MPQPSDEQPKRQLPTGLERLCLSSIRSLDFGIIDAAFQAEVARCAKDCSDRPGLDKDRTVAVVFRFRPKIDNQGNGDGDTVIVDCQIHSGIPKRVTQTYTMAQKHDGTLIFRASDPDDPRSAQLFDPEEINRETGEVRPPRNPDIGNAGK